MREKSIRIQDCLVFLGLSNFGLLFLHITILETFKFIFGTLLVVVSEVSEGFFMLDRRENIELGLSLEVQ